MLGTIAEQPRSTRRVRKKLLGVTVDGGKVRYRVEEKFEGWMRLLGQVRLMKVEKKVSMRQLTGCRIREGTKIGRQVDGVT
jgi:hypothetical protein